MLRIFEHGLISTININRKKQLRVSVAVSCAQLRIVIRLLKVREDLCVD